MEIVISEAFLPAIRSAAMKLDWDDSQITLEKPFDGFYVAFANPNISKEKIYDTLRSRDLVGKDGPDIVVVCENILGPNTG